MSLSFLGDVTNAANTSLNTLYTSILGWFNERNKIKLQNELNRQAWIEQAMYNSPEAQASRFAKAGFNRNLALPDGGNMSQPMQQFAPDYSQSIANLRNLNTGVHKSIADKMFNAEQRERDRDLTRSAQQLEQQRIDNARLQLEINKDVASMNIKKGNLVAAGLALDNDYKARSLAARVQNQINVAGISGNRYVTTSAEALTAPEFFQLRNNNIASQIAYRRAMAALGWSNLDEKRRQFDKSFDLRQRQFYHTKTLNWENYQLAAQRVAVLEGQLRVAQDAEERKQIEQRLKYSYQALEDLLKFTTPIPQAPRTISTKSPMGTTTKKIY